MEVPKHEGADENDQNICSNERATRSHKAKKFFATYHSDRILSAAFLRAQLQPGNYLWALSEHIG